MKEARHIDSRPDYWIGRAIGSMVNAGHDTTERDARHVAEYLAIADALRANKPLGTIAEYKAVSARVTR